MNRRDDNKSAGKRQMILGQKEQIKLEEIRRTYWTSERKKTLD